MSQSCNTSAVPHNLKMHLLEINIDLQKALSRAKCATEQYDPHTSKVVSPKKPSISSSIRTDGQRYDICNNDISDARLRRRRSQASLCNGAQSVESLFQISSEFERSDGCSSDSSGSSTSSLSASSDLQWQSSVGDDSIYGGSTVAPPDIILNGDVIDTNKCSIHSRIRYPEDYLRTCNPSLVYNPSTDENSVFGEGSRIEVRKSLSDVIPTLITTGHSELRINRTNSWRESQSLMSAATRGAVVDYRINRRIRCDPVKRWEQYQYCWNKDKWAYDNNCI